MARSWLLPLLLLVVIPETPAADEKPKRTLGWFNQTELSVVFTDGNSGTRSLGFKNTLRRAAEKTRFRFKMDFVRTETTDDRFLQVDPGFTFLPGDEPTGFTAQLVEPPLEPDVEKGFVEARFDRDISKAFFWSAGTSWDRNVDAGILNRYVVFGGLGNQWWSRDDLRFSTSYSLSGTDREEEEPDPEKEDRFVGLRLDSEYRLRLAASTTYENDLTANMSLADTSDYAIDLTNSFHVALGGRLSLKVSLQWLFNNEPALEDVDLVARVELVDPDGTPGTGDEFYRTVGGGGTEITLREERVRKKDLDTVFRTTLVVDF